MIMLHIQIFKFQLYIPFHYFLKDRMTCKDYGISRIMPRSWICKHFRYGLIIEALETESVMCDVIKIRLERRDVTKSRIKKAPPKIW